MLDAHPDLTPNVIFGLGWLYLLLFGLNAGWTYRVFKCGHHFRMPQVFGGQEVPTAGPWAMYAALLLMVAFAHLTGSASPERFLLRLPESFREPVDRLVANPITFFVASMLIFAAIVLLRGWFARPAVAWTVLNAVLLGMALAMTDWDFRQIVGKPDNVPIVGMLFIVGFFTWLFFRRANENDRRRAAGEKLIEETDNEKVLVWPDLVYTEMLCMILLTVVLVAWGVLLQAPLEEPANAAKTPNPSKAPWYFLGLQEMLVYYDPWLAGVVFPTVILGGLMAIPYIDFNKLGNGYYTFNERKFAISTFLFGFLPLWVAMIILGTFLRGPNWNMFGLFEYWDVHKLEVLNNVNLSEYFWIRSPWGGALGGLPEAAPNAGALEKTGVILLREAPGFLLVIGYLVALPPLMAATVFRQFFLRMGFVRYMVFSNLVLMMLALPFKMVLRWSINLKYLVAIPEWFFNI
jgi:hypothetical protein